jgi:hypothetical protein
VSHKPLVYVLAAATIESWNLCGADNQEMGKERLEKNTEKRDYQIQTPIAASWLPASGLQLPSPVAHNAKS